MGSHQRRVTGERHGRAERIAVRPVGGRQFGLLRPGSAGTGVDVGGAGEGVAIDGLPIRADQSGVAGDGHRVAEVVPVACVGAQQLSLLRPRCAGAREDVGSPGTGVGTVLPGHADQRTVSGEGHRRAELCTIYRAWVDQLGLLRPGRAGTREDVGGAGKGMSTYGLPIGAGQCGVAGERHRVAQPVACRRVGCRQLGLLRPGRACTCEDVGGAGAGIPVDGRLIGADKGGVARDGHGAAQAIVGCRGGCRQFSLLQGHCGQQVRR